MTYKPVHAWKRKDKLPSKDPQKIIYGSQLQDEFDAISSNLKGLDDQVNCEEAGPSGLYGKAKYMLDLYGSEGQPSYDDTQIKADLASETQARIAGDADLQTQIDNLPSGGGGASSWDELTGKPAEFPPTSHGHEEIASGAAYIKYEDDTWKASPSMEVAGDLTVSGEAALDGGLEVTGDINASGSISVDGDLAITGKIEGDLTINGNITIDGGQIVDPDGNPAGGSLTHVGDTAPADPIEGQMWLNTDDGYLYVYFSNSGNPTWMAVERSS